MGQLSLMQFYFKRIRRLFPALLVTVLLTLFAAYFFLASANMPRLGKVGGASLSSISNFLFLGEQGYFNGENYLKPLLHTWSLGVEEQFYLLWPIILMVVYKLGKKALLFTVILLVFASLLGAEHLNESNPNLVFYMLPFRMFEFLLGVLAIFLQSRIQSANKFLFFVPLLGVSIIFLSCMFFDATMPMPGIYSLIPCFAVVAVLAVPLKLYPPLAKMLNFSERIGLASYSIYLVHWPLVVYYKMYKIDELVSWEKIMLFALSIILGYLMWRFVEQKFRYKENEPRLLPYRIFVPIFLMLTLALSGFYIFGAEQSQLKTGNELVLTEENLETEMKRYWQDASPNSPILKGNDDSEVIVMGNSHAVDLIYAFKRNGLQSKIHSLPTSHLCYHFGFESILPKDKNKCKKLSIKHLNVKYWKGADAIFLHDHWPEENLVALRKTLLEIRKKTDAPIYVFGPKMVFKSTIPQLVKASGTTEPNLVNSFAVKYSDLEQRTVYDSELAAMFDSTKLGSIGIQYVSLLDEKGIKEIMDPSSGEYYYFDKSHLTELGAIELGKRIKSSMPELFMIDNNIGR